jgi:RNA polymerase sigma-70 factor (ECF subfamily)
MTSSNLPEMSDEELVRRTLADRESDASRQAASALLGRYRRRAYAWCWRRVGQHDLALDLAQDALLKAYRGLASWSGEGPFAGWLFAIVRNRCRTAMRRRSLVRDDEVDLDALPDRGPDVLDGVAQRMDGERVLSLIREHLTPHEQQALWMRAMEGLSVDEITRALEVDGRSGARGLLQTARRKLRAALEAQESRRKESP